MTVARALLAGRRRLQADGDAGRFDALRLLEETLGRNAAWLLAHGDDDVDAASQASYDAAVARRALGEPVAYIVGSVGFYARTFFVTPDVLVPRPESEGLIVLACEFAHARALATPRFCDVGTGSGVLAITLACESPRATVTAIDVSTAALAVARRNARMHDVEGRIRFVRGDVFADDAAGDAPHARYDCIVANLPYVRSGDLQPAPHPTSFEPALALDGGCDGLTMYRRLLAEARPRLAPNGALLLEAGPDTTGALAELAVARFGRVACVHVHRDFGGRERIVDIRFGHE